MKETKQNNQDNLLLPFSSIPAWKNRPSRGHLYRRGSVWWWEYRWAGRVYYRTLKTDDRETANLRRDQLRTTYLDSLRSVDGVLFGLIGRSPDFAFYQSDIDTHIVYVVLWKNSALYVGSSRSGLRRPFTYNHETISRLGRRYDRLLIWKCSSKESAHELESLLMVQLRPSFNKIQSPKSREIPDRIPDIEDASL